MKTLLRVGRGATPQIALSEVCICVNTVVAPNTIAAKPAMVGSSPLCWIRLFSTAVWIAAAAVLLASIAAVVAGLAFAVDCLSG